MASFIPIFDGVRLFHPEPAHHLFRWRGIASNVILLEGEDGFSLIDSGGINSDHQLIRACDQLGIGKKGELACIHTHGHIDHCGGNYLLSNHFNAHFWAAQEAIPFVKSGSPIVIDYERQFVLTTIREIFTGPEWFVKFMTRLLLGHSRAVSSVEIIPQDSDPIMTKFLPVPLPGHHAGHLGFFSKQKKILIAGDLIDPRYDMKPLLTSPSSDFGAMRISLDAVSNLDLEILVPSHGEPLIGTIAIQQAIKQAKSILDRAHDKVLATLESKSCTLPQLSAEMWGLNLGPGDVYRRIFIHSVLRHLLLREKKIRKTIERKKTIFELI